MEDKERKLYPMLMIPHEREGDVPALYNIADLGVAADTMVANGWLGGNKLSELMETYLDRIVGDNAFYFYGTQFPVMIKTLEVKEKTPIMVNAGDEDSEQRYDSFGKTALWYVAGAEPGSRVYMGFSDEVSAAELYQRNLMGDVESLMNVVEPAKGDIFLINPGVVYAAGPGLKIVEVSEASELSFRLGSEMEEAFDLIDLGAYDWKSFMKGKDTTEVSTPLVSVPQFALNRIDLRDAFHRFTGEYDCFIVYHCLCGEASIQVPVNGGGGSSSLEIYGLKSGQTVLVPADMEDFFLIPAEADTVLLEVTMEHRSEEDPYVGPTEKE